MKTTKTVIVKEFDSNGNLLKHTETTTIEETQSSNLDQYKEYLEKKQKDTLKIWQGGIHETTIKFPEQIQYL